MLLIKNGKGSHPRSIKKLLLKISNIHRKTPVLESCFNKVARMKACNFIKKILQHRCSLKNLEEFLKTPFLKTSANGCSYFIYYCFQIHTEQENAMRCNNCDDLLQLSFTLKISTFSEAYI